MDIELQNPSLQLSDLESKKILLEMLVEFDEFCNKNNLEYFLASGTLLGAVRHHGFIPWDDDADVFMLRKEYEKLLQFDRISDKTVIVSVDNCHGYYHPFPYADLADTRTIQTSSMLKRNTGKGQFIDIFVLDNIPDNSAKEKKQYRQLKFLTTLRKLCVSPYIKDKSFKGLLKNAAVFLCRPIDEIKLAKLINNIGKQYMNEETKKVGMIVFDERSKLRWNTEWFNGKLITDFEGYKLSIPVGYHQILTNHYGDYMTPPPEDQRNGHHGIKIYWKS